MLLCHPDDINGVIWVWWPGNPLNLNCTKASETLLERKISMAGSGIESRNSVEHRLPDYEPSRISWCNLVDKLPSVFIMNIEIKLEMLLPMYS